MKWIYNQIYEKDKYEDQENTHIQKPLKKDNLDLDEKEENDEIYFE